MTRSGATSAPSGPRLSIQLGYSPELDGLRGVAIALVLVYHYLVAITPTSLDSPGWWVMRALGGSWSGVDLFFVLSGYLIGGVMEDHHESPNFLRVFYWRRACRILPAYAVNLIATVLIPLAFLDFFRETPLDPGDFPVWSYFLLVQNLVMAWNGAFGGWALTWSLAVEEQFYLLLPALFLLARKRLVAILIALGLAAPVLRFFLPNPAAYVLPMARADSLFLGVLLAILVRRRPDLAFKVGSNRVLVPILTGCSMALAIFEPRWRVEPMKSAGMLLLALTFGALVLRSQARREGALGHALRNRGLMWIGQRSYFVYLAHVTVLAVMHGLFRWRSPRNDGLEGFAVTLIAAASTLLAAEVSWRLVESPAIQAGRRRAFIPADQEHARKYPEGSTER